MLCKGQSMGREKNEQRSSTAHLSALYVINQKLFLQHNIDDVASGNGVVSVCCRAEDDCDPDER